MKHKSRSLKQRKHLKACGDGRAVRQDLELNVFLVFPRDGKWRRSEAKNAKNTLSENGSVESLKLLLRCGCRAKS